MTNRLNRILTTLIAGFFAFGTTAASAAKAPVSPENLKKNADHIVSGTVLVVSSETQKSKVEKAAGIHRDRVFTITLQVKTIGKGAGIKAGDQIEIVAWRPSSRVPPWPGLQGHDSIPGKGDMVTVYLRAKNEDCYEPLLPNGIQIDKVAK